MATQPRPTVTRRAIITLTTDFGTADPYVGAVKGVILNVNPDAVIHDISHDVTPFDILDGAFTISQAYRYYPPRTIHLVVVDPGVGTARRPILAIGEQHYFIAPDNGVLSLVFEQQERLSVRQIEAEHYFLSPVSNTFHARDIFAPVAGWFSKAQEPQNFGPEITDFVRLAPPKPKVLNEKLIKGIVLKVDTFGNIITNLTPKDVPQLFADPPQTFKIVVGKQEVTKISQTYTEGGANEVFGILGSTGFLELATSRGFAARLLGVQRGAEIGVMLG